MRLRKTAMGFDVVVNDVVVARIDENGLHRARGSMDMHWSLTVTDLKTIANIADDIRAERKEAAKLNGTNNSRIPAPART